MAWTQRPVGSCLPSCLVSHPIGSVALRQLLHAPAETPCHDHLTGKLSSGASESGKRFLNFTKSAIVTTQLQAPGGTASLGMGASRWPGLSLRCLPADTVQVFVWGSKVSVGVRLVGKERSLGSQSPSCYRDATV